MSYRQSCGQHFRQGRIQDITQDFSQEVKVVCSSISRSGSVLGQSCDSPADRISDRESNFRQVMAHIFQMERFGTTSASFHNKPSPDPFLLCKGAEVTEVHSGSHLKLTKGEETKEDEDLRFLNAELSYPTGSVLSKMSSNN